MTTIFFLRPRFGGSGYGGQPQVIPTTKSKKKPNKVVVDVRQEPEVLKKEIETELPSVEDLIRSVNGKKAAEALQILADIEREIEKIRKIESYQNALMGRIFGINKSVEQSNKRARAIAIEIERIRQQLLDFQDEDMFLMLILGAYGE